MKRTSTSNLLQKIQEENLRKKQGLNLKEQKGITLIALVVTIVVLLILAGITITFVLGEGGILDMAKEAARKTNEAVTNDLSDMNTLAGDIQNWVNGVTPGGGGSTGETADPSTGTDTPTESTTPEIPEGLKVGSTVEYNPSGTYTWWAKYCSSTKNVETENVELSSGTGGKFTISSWKVLSIDEETGNVELVPSKQTTGTVYLGEAQGYNNGVKLLNDACSALYGRTDGKITARSINIEDIEKYMTDTAILDAHASPYDIQPYNAYAQGNSWYPAIYAQENKAVIDGETKSGGLGMSDTPNNFIERTVSVGDTTETNEKVQATTSIQPYQTYWYKDANFMKTAFKSYDNNGGNYYNLIMPSGAGTTYWVASRCVYADSRNCNFTVRNVFSGLNAYDMFDSYDGSGRNTHALFPVVALGSELIKSEEESFKVE